MNERPVGFETDGGVIYFGPDEPEATAPYVLSDEERDAVAEIDWLTCLFAESAEAAIAQAGQARGALEKLTGAVYDVELAEGADGEDALAELDDALRHLRNAARIAKHRRSLMLEDPRLKG